MADAQVDPFEADYSAGVLRADPAPPGEAAGLTAGDFQAEAMPASECALAGCLLTSERVLERGFVRFGGGDDHRGE